MSKASPFGLPLFTWLLPLLPIVQIAAANVERTSPLDAVWVAVPVLVVYVLVALLLQRVFRRSSEVAHLLLGIVFCAVFLPAMLLAVGQSRVIWVLSWTALAVMVVVWAEARRFMPLVFTSVPAVLMLTGLVQLAGSPTWTTRPALMSVARTAFEPVPLPASVPAEKPDIYYFVFDRYQRADYLKTIYGHDNSAFLDALRQRGFVVSDQAYSNYQRTAHSVVSSLNFDYLTALQRPETKNSSDWYPLFSMFQDFRIGRVLDSLGYDIHFSGTWWEPTRRLAIADINHTFYEMPELPRVLYEHSLLVSAARLLGLRSADPLYWQCQRSRLMFERVRAPKTDDKPIFHFAHFLIPHPPFVTNEHGHCMSIAEAQSRSRARNYVGQLTYANAQILATVDALLARPGPRPIIILQADEGPWPKKYAGADEVTSLGRDVSSVDWTTADAETLREKMSILSAVYAPALAASEFPATHSPVNTFRRILKGYFQFPLAPLPDRHMVYHDNANLYEFKDVTDVLTGRAP